MTTSATTKRILFVDDEQHILDGLGNLLRKQRKRWQMTFALGGDAALAELRKGPCDVVVSDMRMPGMDGAALLERVKENYPGTARIILSGQADREAVLAALRVAHQFLSKPCTGEALTAVIERTLTLRTLLENEQVRDVVGKLERLPSAPVTYLDLVRTAADPKAGIADLASIVERDPAMSIKVLQLVNSAFFGLARPMASVSKAVNYLGSDLLKGLALNAHVFGMLEDSKIPGFSLDRLQENALLCGRLAGRFAQDKRAAEEALTAALVKDAGKIVLCQACPERFAEVVLEAQRSRRAFHLVEQQALGITHAEIGAYLLGVWGLPYPIVEAVALHRRPGQVTDGMREVLAAVHVAAVLVEERDLGMQLASQEGGLDPAFLDGAGFGGQVAAWREQAEREFLTSSADKGAKS